MLPKLLRSGTMRGMIGYLKSAVKKGFQALGVEMHRSGTGEGLFAGKPATAIRPVGQLGSFLRDVAARGFSPKQILDVGANEGHWSEDARAVFPSAQFTLIEPQAELKPHLDRFCASSPGARWLIAGAGSAPGELKFNVVASDSTSSSFLYNASEGANLRTVPIITVDSAFEGRDALPDLMKIDAEGFELEVLKGATRVLGHAELVAVEAMFFEFRPNAPTFLQLAEFMAKFDYSIYDFTWFSRRPSDGALGLAEVFFCKNSGKLRASKAW